jgi:hypothetical protein
LIYITSLNTMMRRTLTTFKGIQWLEDNLPVTYLEDDADWAEIYRGKKGGSSPAAPVAPASAAPPTGDVCPHCGKPLGK